ncbi:hypothetical protein BHE74_00051419 [Ensete ventricosum]|nr:hypothetical protein BHE74_00051419 [Ensete ventricosum]
MQWELTGNSLGVHRRNREARYEHAGRSPEEDCKTHHKNVGDYRIGRKILMVVPSVSDDCTAVHMISGSKRQFYRLGRWLYHHRLVFGRLRQLDRLGLWLYHPGRRLYYPYPIFRVAFDSSVVGMAVVLPIPEFFGCV